MPVRLPRCLPGCAGTWLLETRAKSSGVRNPMETVTQTSATVHIAANSGIDASTSEIVDTRIINISSSSGPVVSATHAEPGGDEISAFFERPLLINTYTWPSTVTSGTQIQNMDPWYLYLNNPIVKRKTANFYKISGTLVLDVVIQAAPTQYGHSIVQLVPQGIEQYLEPYSVEGAPISTLDFLPTIWQSTQDVYGDLDPATSESLEFRLPWISTQDAIELGKLSTVGPLGGGLQTQWRYLAHCVVPLNNATNVASVGDVTVRVFARIENVKLSIPLTAQSGKKKEQGRIGKLAGAVSSVAGAIKGVPFIGEIAAGVEVVSNAIGSVADWFGFTRVSSYVAAIRVRNETLPGLPHVDGEDAGTSLTILQKNAVAIDPDIFGSGGKIDIESFDELFRRKTLVSLTTWPTSAAPGTILTTINVTPDYCHVATPLAYPTTAGFVGKMFTNWRGPMYFEIQVRCSTLHRGMLQIVYHPSSDHDTTDPTNTSFNTCFEIEVGCSHTFYVGWAQNTICRRLDPGFGLSLSDLYRNGTIDVRVFTKLVAPDPGASVTVEVYSFTSGEMQFYNPVVPGSALRLESGDEKASGAMMTEVRALVGKAGEDVGDISAIIGGERIMSIRSLLQRPFLFQQLFLNVDAADTALMRRALWRLPIELPWFRTVDNSLVPPGASTNLWTPLSWLPFMYVGWRGSVRSKFMFQTGNLTVGNAHPTPQVVRAWAANVVNAQAFTVDGPYDGDPNNIFWQNECGWFETDPRLGGSVEVSSTFYREYRYALTRVVSDYTDPADAISTNCVDLTMVYYNTAAEGNQWPVQRYISAGQDFSLGRFRFVPRVVFA